MKTVIEMAREAGFSFQIKTTNDIAILERFAELVRADERARMAEQKAQQEPVATTCRDSFLAGYETAQADAKVCDLPPHGWHCTRNAGHEGPCAAVETDDHELVAHAMKRLAEQPAPVLSAGPITPEMMQPSTQEERNELERVLKTHLKPAPVTKPYEQEPVAWRELCRRLYVELFHCDRQMTATRDEEGGPMWQQGATVRDVLADAKAALETPPPASKPLVDVIKAAQGVLELTEISHRPPKRDRLEVGRMVKVRLHALADLHDALMKLNIKENT